MRKIFSICLLFVLVQITNAQTGRISGTILDAKTGETLPGAVVLIEGTTRGASADFDGKFSINNVPVGNVNLVVSYISYSTKKIAGVTVTAGDPIDVNVKLEPAATNDLNEVEIVVTLSKENNTALVLQQKNSSSVSDGISAETIRRSPDKNTSDVLKRVSGVTIQDDKFVIIRGLNERYNSSFLNGAPLPSTEPDKKAFSFDLFPSNMLDNIIINKTATPDMPSEFAGGIVQINTKSIPEKNFVSFSSGAGYNTVTTGKDKIVYDGGKYDKFGFDDGSRNIPSQVPSYLNKETWISNDDQAKVAGYFKNDWAFNKDKFKPNASYQFATGYNFKRKEKDFFGAIFSLAYNKTENFYNLQRAEYDGILPKNTIRENVIKEKEYFNKIYQTQSSTGALLNLYCKLNENNSIGLKSLFTGAADNRFVSGVGTNNTQEANVSINRVNSRYFSANRIFSSQLSGDHLMPVSKIKISWNGGYSQVRRAVPNFRVTSYNKYDHINPTSDPSVDPNPLDTVYHAEFFQSTGPSYSGYRVYNELNENIKSGKVDVSKIFKVNEDFKIEGKVGGMTQVRVRQYDMRSFGLQEYKPAGLQFDPKLVYLPENQIFAPENMSITPSGLGGFKAFENTKDDDNYKASSKLYAGYGMAEFKYTEKIRAIAGVRFESYLQKLTVKYPIKDSVYTNTTVNDVLPSLNLIYNPIEKIGVRLSYYKTLNRPEFRELAKIIWYDPETRLSVSGNEKLVRCYIQNFDARFEVFPGRGQLFTVSGFYKYFNNPIERYMLGGQENQIVYNNAKSAVVSGAELEYRINAGVILGQDSSVFLNNLNLFSNLSLIKSSVDVQGINSAVANNRTMQGQSPYIINAGISYVDNKNWFSFTAMVNRVGERIYIVGNDIITDRWEKARTVIDLQATKSFLENRLEIRFNLKDLLHQDYVIYYKGNDRKNNSYDSKVDFVNFKRNLGSTFSCLITYKF